MLSAIDSAMTSVALSVYIFDYDASGLSFIEALKAARKRGVAVRVLIDDVGARYSTRAVDRELSRDGVHCARFLPRRARFLPFLNLRNHRKSLIVDGRKAFLGGMNVRHGHVIAARPRHPVRDIHFAVAGPVIDQMNAVFEQDWKFAAGEDIDLPRWTSDSKASLQSDAVTRFVPDGPDDYFEKLQWLLLGAIAVSRHRICIMTPYFLPNEILSSALMVAALRGVGVEVIVPEISNLPFIDWAMRAAFGRLIEHGVKIYTTQPPFDHSKLMVVDGIWSLVGSSNWDQRSLRLNFEANLECFDDVLGARLEAYFDARRSMASTLHLSDFQNTSSLVRLRNNVAALLSPYL
jgi:cardiolipin synthase